MSKILIVCNNDQYSHDELEQINLSLVDESEHFDSIYYADGGFSLKLFDRFKNCHQVYVGDNDSYSFQEVVNIEKVVLPKEKDDTDLAYILRMLKEDDELVILSLFGGRTAMTLAALQSLSSFKFKYVEFRTLNEHGVILRQGSSYRIYEGGLTFNVLSLSPESKKVEIRNSKYTFDGDMTNLYPVGVSNISTSDTEIINNGDGIILVIVEHNKN